MRVEVGEEAPDFTLPDHDGNDWSVSAHRGRPVVLYFHRRDVLDADGRVLATFAEIDPKDQSAKALAALRRQG